jgi:hypothetical protein
LETSTGGEYDECTACEPGVIASPASGVQNIQPPLSPAHLEERSGSGDQIEKRVIAAAQQATLRAKARPGIRWSARVLKS